MRRSLLVLIIAAVVAIFFGLVGSASGLAAFDTVSGFAWITALVAGVVALPFWHRILPDVPAMPGLFRRPAPGQRWCVGCGSPAAKGKACKVCGHAPKPPRSPRTKPSKATK